MLCIDKVYDATAQGQKITSLPHIFRDHDQGKVGKNYQR